MAKPSPRSGSELASARGMQLGVNSRERLGLSTHADIHSSGQVPATALLQACLGHTFRFQLFRERLQLRFRSLSFFKHTFRYRPEEAMFRSIHRENQTSPMKTRNEQWNQL